MSNPEHAIEHQAGYMGPKLSDVPASLWAPGMEPSGWTKAYHPSGLLVTLPVRVSPTDYRAMFAAVGAIAEAGFLAQAPGLEEGEEKETVGWCLKGEHERDGETTPFVLLYANNEQLKHSFLKVYLNRPEDVAAFEFAARLKLKDLPEYDGHDKPERGKSAKTDKYIVAPPRPFGVVFKANPKYDEAKKEAAVKAGEVYPVPKRVFVRWADQRPEGKPAEPAKPEPRDESKLQPLSEKDEKDWLDWLDLCSMPAKFDEARAKLENVQDPWRSRLKERLRQRADACGCVWDARAGAFRLK
jgi:hypothetical protein